MGSLQRRKVPRLSPAELERLHKEKNWRALWEQAIPLVGFAIKKLLRNGRLHVDHSSDDLIQQGNLFARKYVESWNPQLGKFSTWLVSNIYRQLLQEISRNAKGMVGGRYCQGTTGTFNENSSVTYSTGQGFSDPLNELLSQQNNATFRAALAQLAPKHLDIIRWIYGIDQEQGTLESYAQERRHGVRSRMTARRVLADAKSILILKLSEQA